MSNPKGNHENLVNLQNMAIRLVNLAFDTLAVCELALEKDVISRDFDYYVLIEHEERLGRLNEALKIADRICGAARPTSLDFTDLYELPLFSKVLRQYADIGFRIAMDALNAQMTPIINNDALILFERNQSGESALIQATVEIRLILQTLESGKNFHPSPDQIASFRLEHFLLA